MFVWEGLKIVLDV